jgi:hypothetical protein
MKTFREDELPQCRIAVNGALHCGENLRNLLPLIEYNRTSRSTQ